MDDLFQEIRQNGSVDLEREGVSTYYRVGRTNRTPHHLYFSNDCGHKHLTVFHALRCWHNRKKFMDGDIIEVASMTKIEIMDLVKQGQIWKGNAEKREVTKVERTKIYFFPHEKASKDSFYRWIVRTKAVPMLGVVGRPNIDERDSII